MRTELRRPLASVGLTALLLLTAATVPAVAGVAPSPAASPGAVTGPSAHPPGLEAVTCGEGAPAGARCDTLWVPLDYADPSRGTIATSVIVIPAKDPAERIGSLLVNPGGPGESGVQFVEAAYPLFATLNQRFDIVGFDPRGTTGPDAVACEGTDALDHEVGLDPLVAGSPAGEADLVATTLAFDESCRLHSGWLLPYVGTANAARDMDALRAALGDCTAHLSRLLLRDGARRHLRSPLPHRHPGHGPGRRPRPVAELPGAVDPAGGELRGQL